MILCANLATAPGSFLVDGWRVWNNATISGHSTVETEHVPAETTLATGQTLWICTRSSLRLTADGRIILEKGCARLDGVGTYHFEAKFVDNGLAGSGEAELVRATDIIRQYHTLRELRPTSQRP